MSHTKYRMNYPILVTALGFCAAASSMAAQNQSNAERFSATGNAVTKRQIISEIGMPASATLAAADVNSTARLAPEDAAVLSLGLDDPKPTVVEASVRRIGELKAPGFEDKLIVMFENADKKYPPGYSESMKASIISTIGRCSGPKSFRFIDDLMFSNEATPLIKFILLAARETGNPSLLESVATFREKMALQLQKKKNDGADPIEYSELQTNIRLAREVESSLTETIGGKK